ncbi:hypothetical protein EXIGLDRAFT_378930 [Exidia glandulosa HHB12029]|uniref:Nephrocystin 3-like N-terminal domain-containing protein n=1 Tax=Exidia glandulosa HHB12029 TaxID=1314781 RepID=A0A165L570_EXIGL|nr:hypothetical protein EXIGLDRAFT_378930 [Exidia glandulosa HHB12029]
MRFHDRMLVNRLKPVFSARYGAHGSPGDCLEHTRLALLNDLREYLTANDGRRIVWLYGLAGTGKSTVARSICSGLKDTHDVVSFFIKRDIFDHSNQKRILHTLVYQLAQCIPQVFSAVIHAKDDLFEAHVHDQVEDLVRTPLSAVLPGARPVVIILDAVDERGGTKNECDIIPCFLDAIAAAQVPVRVFVTSRGQPSDFLRPTYDSEAVHATQGLPLSLVQYVLIHHKSYDPEGDIRAYLAAEFKRVALKRTVSDWPPSPDQIDILVRMSARLFIFAATIIRWVDCSAPVFALGQLLEQSSALMERTGPETIFALYEYVICHALDEDTPRQLLRSALGKDPNDRTEADALCREATLSILSTVRCLRERLTRNVFAHLWAGHIIAEPTIRAGAVAIAEHLISRLSGVLFVWNPDSSVMLLHASFGDFLDARSSPYHISSETTHFELASKCVSIMLSTKDAYDQFHSTSFVDPLLNRRLDAIPWIGPDSDLAARYSFAHWIPHASRALPTQLPRLLEQVRLAERGFWSAGVFLHPADINVDSLKQAHNAMRTHREGVEAAYTLATVVYMCADEASDFKDASRRRGLNSFDTVLDALSILAPLSGKLARDTETSSHPEPQVLLGLIA